MRGTRGATEKAGTLQTAGLLTYHRARIRMADQPGCQRARKIGHLHRVEVVAGTSHRARGDTVSHIGEVVPGR